MASEPMNPTKLIPSTAGGNDIPSTTELEDYGAMIVKELNRAEDDLDDGDFQPFSGMSSEVMHDIAHLRTRQFDMFRRHVEIEQGFKIHGSSSTDGNMTFANIATTMRKKENATAGLLNRLADFDHQLRAVMDKFEPSGAPNSSTASVHAPHKRATTLHRSNRPIPPTATTSSSSDPVPNSNSNQQQNVSVSNENKRERSEKEKE